MLVYFCSVNLSSKTNSFEKLLPRRRHPAALRAVRPGSGGHVQGRTLRRGCAARCIVGTAERACRPAGVRSHSGAPRGVRAEPRVRGVGSVGLRLPRAASTKKPNDGRCCYFYSVVFVVCSLLSKLVPPPPGLHWDPRLHAH